MLIAWCIFVSAVLLYALGKGAVEVYKEGGIKELSLTVLYLIGSIATVSAIAGIFYFIISIIFH